ncbi:hypothetical protein ONR57_22935 [Hoyosella sp. YIM 151337]|uniref:hypothetical protein n=1 Tax=Hoyosella sp. YIM 151337 TaxID=2992742 RepID=UPI0022359B8F|nr:hypothetical protein [Hoyosella sp. YIM 151337]MCW4356166.1 hypothetical protein [Hoyosella sp. YIM 151337]
MTEVPWGSPQCSGDAVENFVAALLLLKFPSGTRITPSQGDQGVDIKVPTGGGFDVYQVKKYSTALDGGQASKVEKSWDRVNAEFGAENTITGWYLVMPWDPTHEREKWFRDLTKDAGFPCEWRGRAHLNGWAADNPRLVEYFFGSGAERLEKMIASLTLNGTELEDSTGDSRLDAVTNRYLQLQNTLDDLSPFYTYRLNLISASNLARMREEKNWSSSSSSVGVTTYRRVSSDYYVEISVTPISAAAAAFDPISVRMEISADEPADAEELERYFKYGIAPTEAVDAVVVEAHGPPGAVPELAPGMVRLADVTVPSPWETLALHCTTNDPFAAQDDRAESEGGDDDAVLELGPIVTTEGARGRAFRARGEAIEMELLVGRSDDPMTISAWAVPIGDKLPHRVLQELVFAQKLWSGDFYVCLTIPNGPALVESTRPPARPHVLHSAQQWTDVAVNLMVLQRFSHRQLRMPHYLTGKEAHTIESAAQMALTGTIEHSWENLRVVSPAMPLTGIAALVVFQPLVLVYDGATHELDITVRSVCDQVEAVEVADDHILVRPVNGAKVRSTLVPRSEYDYRVLTRPVDPGVAFRAR